MTMKKARQLSTERLMKQFEQECGTIDKPEYGLRKFNHYCKKASAKQIYRQLRRNFVYSK